MSASVETKPAVAKHEAFVEHQLARMRSRIRSLDAGRAVLWLLVVTLGYALVTAGLDRIFDLPAWVRLAGFVVFALAGTFLLGSALLCLYRRVNPYYAAIRLEETLPNAKNSVVNWLDLRDEKLPPVILNALGTRAARDLRKADPEQAVSVGPTWILAGVLAGIVLGLLILFVLSPRQFVSLMERAFAPFREAAIASRTTITLVEPEGGNVTVPPNRPITFRANIDGRVPAVNQPGSPQLHFRYNQSDPFALQALEQDRDGTWYHTLAADQVLGGGLWYKITANDAETDEYHVRVIPIPQVRFFEPTYRYRPYLRVPEQARQYSPALFTGLKAPRGTEVVMLIRTNCTLRDGVLRVQLAEGREEIIDLSGEILADDPTAMRFPKLLLDRDGVFTLLFTSKQGERNSDRSPHRIEVIPDLAPEVVLEKPEKDAYPANGTIPLQGSARDDFGIKSMTLRLQAHADAQKYLLEPKAFRPGKSFQLVNGKYPDFLDYKDFVALDKLKTDTGQPYSLKKGMFLEFWLEAVDNSDFPEPNGKVGKSVAHKVRIDDPEKDQKKKDQERKKAEAEKNQHEKNQDQDLEKQNQRAKEQDQANGEKNLEQNAQDDKLKKDAENEAKKIQDKLNKQEGEQNKPDEKGEAKGADGPPSETKKGDDNQAEAKGSKEQGPQNHGQEKDAGAKNPENQAGQARDEGQKDKGEQNPEAQARGPGQDNPEAGPKGSAEKNEPDPKGNGGSPKEKSAPKGGRDKSSASAKDQGKNGSAKEEPGQAKQQNPMEKGTDPQAKGNQKESGKEQPSPQAKGEKSSGQENAGAKSELKHGPKEQSGKDQLGKAKDQGGSEKKGQEQSAAKDNSKDNPQGAAKAEEKNSAPCACKNSGPKSGGNGSPSAKGSNDKGQASADKSQAKQADPKQAKQSGQAKGDPGAGDPGAEKGNGRDAGMKDVAKHADDLNKKDPAAQDEAANELSKIRNNAKDPKVRDAADDALHQANRGPTRSKKITEGTEEHAQAIPKGPGEEGGSPIPGGQVKGDQQSSAPAQAKGDSDTGKQEEAKSETKGGNKAGGYGSGRHGITDDNKAQAVNEDFSKRGGNLTLEDMKELIKKADPDFRKKKGISDQDWQKFIKDVQAYEQILQKQKAHAKIEKSQGTASKLAGAGPRRIDSPTSAPIDPLNIGRFQPPPEFRNAHREFTRPEKK